MLQRDKWKRHPGDQLLAKSDRQVTVLTREGSRYSSGLYELCGRLIRNGDIVVVGTIRMASIKNGDGKYHERRVIDPGSDCDFVIFEDATVTECWASKSSVKLGRVIGKTGFPTN